MLRKFDNNSFISVRIFKIDSLTIKLMSNTIFTVMFEFPKPSNRYDNFQNIIILIYKNFNHLHFKKFNVISVTLFSITQKRNYEFMRCDQC